VADRRPEINTVKSFSRLGYKIRVEGPKYTQGSAVGCSRSVVSLECGSIRLSRRRGDAAGFLAGAADCCWAVWEKHSKRENTPGKEIRYSHATSIIKRVREAT